MARFNLIICVAFLVLLVGFIALRAVLWGHGLWAEVDGRVMMMVAGSVAVCVIALADVGGGDHLAPAAKQDRGPR